METMGPVSQHLSAWVETVKCRARVLLALEPAVFSTAGLVEELSPITTLTFCKLFQKMFRLYVKL